MGDKMKRDFGHVEVSVKSTRPCAKPDMNKIAREHRNTGREKLATQFLTAISLAGGSLHSGERPSNC